MRGNPTRRGENALRLPRAEPFAHSVKRGRNFGIPAARARGDAPALASTFAPFLRDGGKVRDRFRSPRRVRFKFAKRGSAFNATARRTIPSVFGFPAATPKAVSSSRNPAAATAGGKSRNAPCAAS